MSEFSLRRVLLRLLGPIRAEEVEGRFGTTSYGAASIGYAALKPGLVAYGLVEDLRRDRSGAALICELLRPPRDPRHLPLPHEDPVLAEELITAMRRGGRVRSGMSDDGLRQIAEVFLVALLSPEVRDYVYRAVDTALNGHEPGLDSDRLASWRDYLDPCLDEVVGLVVAGLYGPRREALDAALDEAARARRSAASEEPGRLRTRIERDAAICAVQRYLAAGPGYLDEDDVDAIGEIVDLVRGVLDRVGPSRAQSWDEPGSGPAV